MLSSSLRRAGVKSSDVPLTQVRYATAAATAFPKCAVSRSDHSDVRRLRNTGNQLIKGVKQAQNPNWRHTYEKKGESKRLARDLLVKKDPYLRDGRTSNSILAGGHPVEKWTVEEFTQSATHTLQPGTFIELRRNAEWMNGVVISSTISNIGYNEDILHLNTRGEMHFDRSTDVMFAIPNFVDNYLVERCGTVKEHEDQHQLAARLRVLKAAREFDRTVEREQYRLGRAIRDIYPQVRSRDVDEWGKVTTMQVARMLEAAPNVPIVTLFAVHRQLMDRADEFVCHPTRHRFLHAFDVRPLSHLRNIETIKQMAREDNPVIRSFQEKAKFLIDRSRELETQSAGELPSRAEIVDVVKFTEKEQDIITFLKHSMLLGRRIQEDSYAVNVPAILKDTFRYNELITAYVTLKFLREIGVFTPWEDMASKDRSLHIPEFMQEPLVRPVTKSASRHSAQKESARTPGLLTTDAHESVRHDFGDMPIYVIDDKTAQELDDGISVERVPGEPGSVWLHVHVADPTTLIPITHPLSQQIQKRTETYYFGHQSVPMLPDDISELCDMGRSGGQNVLTFSAKIGPNGQILDHEVRASRIRNVHKLRYDDVNGVLLPHVEPARVTPFEPEHSDLADLDTSYVLPHANDFKLAFEVTRRLVKARLDMGCFAFSMDFPEVEFLDKPVLRNHSRVTRPILYRGYPRLRYHVEHGQSPEIGARSIVAECMKLAGRVASRFCLEHNIPAMRRAMGKVEADEARLARVLAARNDRGFVDMTVLAKEGIQFQSSEITTKPLGHWLLGIPDGEGYIRTTSPLRRAEDMIMHWQIKSTLLPGGGSFPPIDDETMNRILEDFNGRKQTLRRAYRAHTRQWAHTFLQRWMAEQQKAGTSSSAEHNPLYQMDGYVTQSPVYNLVRWSAYQDVYIPKIGLTTVLPVKGESPLPIGALVKVNAKEVFQYDLNQTLEVSLA